MAKTKSSAGAIETVKTIVYAILIALVVRSVAFEPFNIPSGSMIPTLLIGDYLFVSKYSYGYSRYSLPFGLPLIPGPGRILYRSPERGDVVVFKLPSDNSTDYIKRLVGLPGDKIAVRDGVLRINGQTVKREKIAEPTYFEGALAVPVQEYIETLPGPGSAPGRQHHIYEKSDTDRYDNWPTPGSTFCTVRTGAGCEFEVPQGQFFAMGDNRDNSQDSRVIGPIPSENLVGRAEFIFFSTNGTARLWEIWKWPFAIRYDRLFTGIE
jgi:signal peptidase I